MNRKYIAAGICALFAIVGWNAFLIQRDKELFRANSPSAAEVCTMVAEFQYDCKTKTH